ncbi:MAG: ribosome maturation factor RimM [Chloroflexota bacterium]
MSERAERPAGSPTAGEPAFLAVGKVRRPHGVGGDALVEIYTDFPERILSQMVIYVGENHLPLTISRRRTHNDGLLLAFEGFTTPEQVGKFRNQTLYTTKADAPELPEGEYYQYELIGLEVKDEFGISLGKLTEIMQTGANDVYVVTNEAGRELLLPAITDVVLDVDLEAKTMKIHLLPGLVIDEESESS